MTSYTLSKSSPTNTTLTDPGGTVVYEITTPFKMHDCETTIKKQGGTIATIHWKVFGKSTLTMDGKTSILKEVLPKPRTMSSLVRGSTPALTAGDSNGRVAKSS
ncbi:hypothetical protein FRC08_015656, partial [Ceratobasidium sp. 394]